MDIMVRATAHGGPDVLDITELTPQEPGPGEIRLRHHAIGVNFIDIYHRTGLYPLPAPFIPGVEGAGTVEAVGAGVEGLTVGDRITYAGLPGAYASTRLLPAWRAVHLPDEVTFETAAGSMLRGLTAHMLLTTSYPVGSGTVVLVHAAAGGLGSMLVQWAKHLGASVIGTASTKEKAAVAKANGADHVIIGRTADIVSEINEITHGKGADFVIDGIGGDMLRRSLKCARPFGTVASIGWVAGPVPAIDIDELGTSVLGKPSVMAYAADPDRYRAASEDVIAAIRSGIAAKPGGVFRLADAASAHASLEAGKLTGSSILVP